MGDMYRIYLPIHSENFVAPQFLGSNQLFPKWEKIKSLGKFTSKKYMGIKTTPLFKLLDLTGHGKVQ